MQIDPAFGQQREHCLCPLRVRNDQRVMGVVAVRDRGELRMHVVGGVRGTFLGN